MEEAIRSAVANLRPGDTTTAEALSHRLGLDKDTVSIWLDVLAGEGRLIREHRALADVRSDVQDYVCYRVPPHG